MKSLRFTLTYRDLNMPPMTDADAVTILRGLPRSGAVFTLQRIAQELLAAGEGDPKVQESLAKAAFLPGELRDGVIKAIQAGHMLASYEGIVRLTAAAIVWSPPGSQHLTCGERDRLFRAMIHMMATTVNSELGAMEPGQIRLTDVLLQGFLMAQAAGPGDAVDAVLLDYAFALLVSASFARLNVKTVNETWTSKWGVTPAEMHQILFGLSSHFVREIGGGTKYMDVVSLFPTDRALSPFERIQQHLVTVLTADIRDPEAVHWASFASPRGAWPVGLRQRPFYQSGTWTVAWDVRGLRRLLSNDFPEVARALQSEGEDFVGHISNHWHSAIEGGIELAAAAVGRPLTRPTGLAKRVEGVGEKTADWVLTEGRHLFIIEFKNLSLPESTFFPPVADYFEAWLKGKFFEAQGFAQVRDTLDRGLKSKWQVGGIEIGAFNGIWPICVTSTAMLVDRATLKTVSDQWSNLVGSRYEGHPVRPPTLLGQLDFLRLLSVKGGRIKKVLARLHRRGASPPWLFDSFVVNDLGLGVDVSPIVRQAGVKIDRWMPEHLALSRRIDGTLR